jgi:hypothetical protein
MADYRSFLSGNLNKYKAVPFWSWNNALEEEHLLRQIEEMHSVGIGGFIMHSRTGMSDEYLGEKWFSCIGACLKKAGELGMNAWCYDENGWPSGFTGGKLLENEAYLAKYLELSRGDFDASAIYASTGSALAVEGLYYNVLDLPYIAFEQPWWNDSIIEEVTLFDTLYYLAGDICITQIANGLCIFYNKNLFSELYGTQNIKLFDVVEKGEWTIDYMSELVSNAWIDENSDGIVSDGDTVGFFANTAGGGMDAWIPAMGISITKMVDGYPEITFYSERTVAAFEKLRGLYNNNPGTLNASATATKFVVGNQLFTMEYLNGGSKFRAMKDNYGVLPLPKFDAEQDDYYTTFDNAASLVVVLSTCNRTDLVGATLELMGAESYKQVTPAYFEICLQGKYSDTPEDAEMYDRIINSFVYSFGFCYSTKSLEGIGGLFRNLDVDIAQKYEANKIKYENALNTLIDKLDEISFLTK